MKRARVDIQCCQHSDGSVDYQPIIHTDDERVRLDTTHTYPEAQANAELWLCQHHLLPDYRRVEQDRQGDTLEGRFG